MITPTDAQVEAASKGVVAEWKVMTAELAHIPRNTPGDIAREFVSPGNYRLIRAALTAAFSLAAPAGTVSFWVLEMIEEPQAPAPRYWAGNGVGWTYDISTAIHFERKEDVDAFQIGDWLRGKAVEHAMISRPSALLPPQPSSALPGKESVGELWQELLEKDDRTSPEEYPDHALITRDELADFIARSALFPPHPSAGAVPMFDEIWQRIGADPQLAHARKVLSIHEIRTILQHTRGPADDPRRGRHLRAIDQHSRSLPAQPGHALPV